MRTNIDIDEGLMAEAQRLSGAPTKKATVEEALRLLIQLRRQEEARELRGFARWTGDLAAGREGRGLG